MSRNATYQLSGQGRDDSRKSVSYALQGRAFIAERMSLDDLLRRHFAGWSFRFTVLSENYPPEAYREKLPEEALLIMVERKTALHFQSPDVPLKLQIGDRVLAYVPPETDLSPPDAEEEAEEDLSGEVREIEKRKEEVIDEVTP